jgi:hypothetical protein
MQLRIVSSYCGLKGINMDYLELRVIDIVVGDRQRKDFGDIDGLKFSIEQHGLIQPIVVENRNDGKYNLIAGGRRLEAHVRLGLEYINAKLLSTLDPVAKQELEYEENYRRKSYTWDEECKTLHKIHKLKKERYNKGLPGRFGRGGWSQRDTATELDVSEAKVSMDIVLAEALEAYPSLKNNANRKDALRALRHIDINKIEDESVLLKRMKESFVNKSFDDGLRDIDAGSVDLVITDLTHLDIETSIASIVPKLNITGHAFAFIPFEKFMIATKACEVQKINFKPKPFIWHIKGEDNYQTYLWFSRAMAAPPRYITEHTSHRRDIQAFHNLAKPYSLYSMLIDNGTLKGGFVFNPCAYDLTMVKLCMDIGRCVRSVCNSTTVYEHCLINLEKKEEAT